MRRSEDEPEPNRTARLLEAAAFWVLLGCLVARVHLGEVPYRTAVLASPPTDASQLGPTRASARAELARVTFAAAILAAGAMWAAAAAARKRLRVRYGWLAVPVGLFAAWSFGSALMASDVRSALDAWIEQVSLLMAGLLAMQLCTSRRRFAWAVTVLAALGVTMAAKGAFQHFIERPMDLEQFASDPAAAYEQAGIRPGSHRATIFYDRARDPALRGYLPLANAFGSMLIVLLGASAGLAAGKLGAARRSLAAWRERAAKDELHLPTLAGIVTAAGAAGVAAVLAFTHSRGAVLAACVGAMAAALLAVFGRWIARRRWSAVAVVAAAVLAGAAGTAAYGLTHDRLPSKTLTFRWYYWTAGAEVVRSRPLLGTGPANFDSGYTQHRRIEGEEAVKMPHNFVVHAAAQYGLPGGALYVGILAAVLVCLARPAPRDEPKPRESPSGAGRPAAIAAGLAGVVLLARFVFSHAGSALAPFVVDALLPAAALAACLLLAWWTGGERIERAASSRAVRITLGCALAAFVLHNAITFSLWVPATGMLFWVASGAVLARTRAGEWRLDRLAVPKALGAVAAVLAAVSLLWWPVFRRSGHTEAAAAAFAAGRPLLAADRARAAAAADPLDPVSAADAARALAVAGRTEAALQAARQACRRDPLDAPHHALAASLAWRRLLETGGDAGRRLTELQRRLLASPADVGLRRERVAALSDTACGDGLPMDGPLAESAIEYMSRAVTLDPQDARLRLRLARLLLAADRRERLVEQLDAAERIDAVRGEMESGYRLTRAERAELEALREASRASKRRAPPQ